MEKVYEAIELARKTGKIVKGTNEVTKAIEKQTAKLVAVAADISPKEITMHLPLLSKEKGVTCIEVSSKAELGASAGIPLGTAAVAIIEPGEASGIVKELGKVTAPAEPEKAEEPKEEKAEEKEADKPKEKTEDKKEDKSE
ncbi:MAG: ribosomal L7Ae/L30e/S12e/Gadd45 family protein [Nanoarchaeota archaeon]|nr:ribosomal L7Ae/L30e/S12e/Gadd45 family protein [Nanoarchaeota archaeon]